MKAWRSLAAVWALSLALPLTIGAQDVDRLIQDLASPSSEKRMDAATALGELGPRASAAVPALVTALGDQDSYVRNFAANALGAVGPAAVSAVPALVNLLHDADESVSQAGQRALAGIGPGAKAAIPELIVMLKTWQSSAAESPAAFALIRIGAASVPSLAQVAYSDDKRIALAAIYCLGEIGSSSREAVAALKTTFQNFDPTICESSAMALRKLGAVSIPIFNENVSNKDPNIRKQSAWSLAKMNIKASLPLLKKQFEKDRNPDVKQALKWSIDQLEGKTEE